MIHKLSSLSLLFLLTTTTACGFFGEDEADSQNAAAGAGGGKNKKNDEESSNEDLSDYSYNPLGKRDPFRSFLVISTDPIDDDSIPRTPLQRYELKQYSLKGIIWNRVDDPVALVADPLGKGHVLAEGDYIGKNWGKVIEITDNLVLVKEEYQDTDRIQVRKIRLTLREDASNE
jgi:type IV pilus assembly protein PilP